MFRKIKKYVIGFFVLCGGVLFAFLTGKSAGRKQEKLGGLKKNIKKTKKSIEKTQNTQKKVKKNIKNTKSKLKGIKNTKYKDKKFGAKETADFLKKYKK